jgi:hypothetical protein
VMVLVQASTKAPLFRNSENVKRAVSPRTI